MAYRVFDLNLDFRILDVVDSCKNDYFLYSTQKKLYKKGKQYEENE